MELLAIAGKALRINCQKHGEKRNRGMTPRQVKGREMQPALVLQNIRLNSSTELASKEGHGGDPESDSQRHRRGEGGFPICL